MNRQTPSNLVSDARTKTMLRELGMAVGLWILPPADSKFF
jgi:hypothetical protein